jgi:hypothetical protein
MIKKTLAVCLAAGAFAFAGCGSSNDSEPPKAQSTPYSMEETQRLVDKVNLISDGINDVKSMVLAPDKVRAAVAAHPKAAPCVKKLSLDKAQWVEDMSETLSETPELDERADRINRDNGACKERVGFKGKDDPGYRPKD